MGEQKKRTKISMHMDKFLSWKVDRRVSELVQATCFKNFLKFEESKHKLNLPLLTVVMSFFDDKQKAFSFPAENSMVDFGLEYILYITGLPIDGKQKEAFTKGSTTKLCGFAFALQIKWQPYSKVELPEYTSQLRMVFAQVPCICFNTITYNCRGTFFKQLGLEESDIRVPPEIKPKGRPSKLSRHKDKDWREHNSFYSQMNLAWENRDNRLVYQRHNEESEGEVPHGIHLVYTDCFLTQLPHETPMNFGSHSRSISRRGGVEAITNDPVDNQDESDEIPFPISVENVTRASNNDQMNLDAPSPTL
ncbi:unnamed protein product [Arabidopsis thaliana]|uniref:Uncharacterized protein n=1 Tax=Arabidopsis thaliana TaxID=3702 RepID=A0A654ES18_ARATH|nr:unnamed protein product [Arabidopsis thaliana]